MKREQLTTWPRVLQLIAAARDASPTSIAVRGPDGVVTYDQLLTRADRLARALHASGVGRGEFVGHCVNRSASSVVGVVGIARAGCAYVAIDPQYPDERIRWMLADSGAKALVADAATDARVGNLEGAPALVLGAAGQLTNHEDPDGAGQSPPLAPGSVDDAYVVYTSGSTGTPKGVVIDHAGLSNLVDWHRAAFALDAGDRCTQISSPGFDAAVWEIWPCLASGATLHIVPEQLRTDPVGLRDWLVAEEITVTFLPTALAEGVIGLSWPGGSALRYLLTGGDALAKRPDPELGFALVNNYGLSETTVVSTSGAVSADGEGPPTIGRPIAGVEVEIVDDELQQVSPGEVGELLIGGPSVGRGYINRPELTRERFVDGPRGRRYRTGDLVRMRPDGEIEFAGRVDDQLSIRGFRVEPGEVAAVLNSHPAVEASVAVAIGDSSADRQLVAYVVATDGVRPSSEELSGLLAGSLPHYMVPSRYVWLDQLPLTPHGKIDRRALPDPGPAVGNEEVGLDPEAPVDATIASVVAQLLKVEQVGMDENFFLIGGHSMLGAQLIARIERLYGVELPLRYLFDHPTPAELADEVQRRTADGLVGIEVGQ
jgi:amino acid adenylation domain-containing protein